MNSPRDSDQLELSLFEGVPWEGRSPRALTRVGLTREAEVSIFPSRAGGHEVFVDPEQYGLWPTDDPYESQGRRGVAPGAPLLVEVPRRSRGRRGYYEVFRRRS